MHNQNKVYNEYKIYDQYNLNIDVLVHIISFFDSDEIYPFIETCYTFYNLILYAKKLPRNIFPYYLKYSIQPQMCCLVSSIKMIEWAKTHKNFKYSYRSSYLCARNGNLNTLKYLLKDGCLFDNKVYYEAALYGHFDIIKWCYKNNLGTIYNNLCMQSACQYGDIKIVKWLFERFFPVDKYCGYHACYFGHLDILKFLISKGYMIDVICYNHAAENGNIHILKYLDDLARHDLSMPWWDETTIVSAVENNQLKIVKYLRKNNCKWDSYATYSAYDNKHMELLYWLIENKCPISYKLYNYLKKEYRINYNLKDINVLHP